jgi:hypothetical protein
LDVSLTVGIWHPDLLNFADSIVPDGAGESDDGGEDEDEDDDGDEEQIAGSGEEEDDIEQVCAGGGSFAFVHAVRKLKTGRSLASRMTRI